MKQGRLWMAAALFSMLLLGCKNRRDSANGNELRTAGKEEVIERHRASHLRFHTLTFKGKAQIEDYERGQSIGFTYRIDVAQDSLVLVNVSKFGVPALTMLLSQDSVHIRVPLNHKASNCTTSDLQKLGGIELDLARLRDYLLGEAALEEPIELTSGKAHPAVLQGIRQGYEMSWILNSRNDRLDKVTLIDRNLGRESTLTYSDFEKVDGQAVASTVLLEVTQPQKSRILLQHSTIAIDKESVDFRFRIPGSYETVPCDQILAQPK